MTLHSGQIATLLTPIKGYRAVELIEKHWYQWHVRLVGNGMETFVYEDEFEID
jgi:hypothetical protein